jgi:hypothetical protein
VQSHFPWNRGTRAPQGMQGLPSPVPPSHWWSASGKARHQSAQDGEWQGQSGTGLTGTQGLGWAGAGCVYRIHPRLGLEGVTPPGLAECWPQVLVTSTRHEHRHTRTHRRMSRHQAAVVRSTSIGVGPGGGGGWGCI